MNIDSFTISRYIFLAFIILISVYFIVENKRPTSIEKFESESTKASAGIGEKPKEVVDAKKIDSSADSTAPKGGSMENLDSKNKQAKDPKDALPQECPQYIPKEDDVIHKEVIKAYQELYQIPPQKEELEFYTEYVKSRNVTKEQLREIIETSAPTLQKTFYAKRNANTPDEVFGMENEIIEIYNELLDRNPDKRELYSFAKMIKSDKDFNLDKLRQVLIASEEFKRMERTQNNKVYVNLQSNITDRQLTMQVTKLYSKITGQDYIDEDTLRFLKKKFVELDLNEKNMTQFINSYISNKPFKSQSSKEISDEQMKEIKKQLLAEIQQNSDAATQSASLVAPVYNASSSKASSNAETTASSNTSSTTASQKEKFQDGSASVYNDAKIFNFFGREGANNEVISSLMANSVNMNGNIDTEAMIRGIKSGGDTSTCRFNKNLADIDMLEKNKQELADYIDDRNRSHLKSVCERNNKYMNADENMVLFPEYKWSVPQQFPPICMGKNQKVNPTQDQTALIGTLLSDAKDTQVGSLLPAFPPV